MKKLTKLAKFVWKIELEEHWSFMDKGEYDDGGLECIVQATDLAEAEFKSRELHIGRTFLDDDAEGNGKIETLEDVRVIGAKRMMELEA
jgi:hypothetical protein